MGTLLRSHFKLLVVVFGMLLAIPAIALADIVVADGDSVTAGAQDSRTLAAVNPGATVTANINFLLSCDSKQHFNSDDTANINFTSYTMKDASNTAATTGSVGATSLLNLKGPQTNCPLTALIAVAKLTARSARARSRSWPPRRLAPTPSRWTTVSSSSRPQTRNSRTT